MSTEDDLTKIAEQEKRLVFESFDEATAFTIGSTIRDRALSEDLGIVIDIRTFDRPLFYAALPGSTASNPDWARRKINVVKRFLKSTYRMVLEQQRPDRSFKPGEGIDIKDYVLAGGGFPVTVKGAGIIGVIAVSGLPERQDHGVIVDTLCDHFGIARQELALPPEADDE
ncbi:MAG: heme-degrading domain-containing protein [Alphaproteobacteria bacterium]|nr:heme-degrading domain-containing protein [Alphaproteobacteria bacterium]